MNRGFAIVAAILGALGLYAGWPSSGATATPPGYVASAVPAAPTSAPLFGSVSSLPGGSCANGQCGINGQCPNGNCGPGRSCGSPNCPFASTGSASAPLFGQSGGSCANGQCAPGACASGKCAAGGCANGQCGARSGVPRPAPFTVGSREQNLLLNG